MNRRQKIIVSVTGIFIVLLILIGLTYAYFLTRITGNSNPNSISVTTANLELVYGDGTTAILTSVTPLMPSSTPIGTKDFTVTNNGDDSEYVVVFEDITVKYAADTVINGEVVTAGTETTFESNDFVYTLTCEVKDKNGNTLSDKSCDGIENETFPMEGGIVLGNSIDKDDIHSYILTLYYLDNGLDQSKDMNKALNGKVNIKDIKSINLYSDNTESLAYNIINNSMLNKNGTELKATPKSQVAVSIGKYESDNYELAEDFPGWEGVTYGDTKESADNGENELSGNNDLEICTSVIGKYISDSYNWLYSGESYGKVAKCSEDGKPYLNYIAEKTLSVTQDNYGISYYYRGNVQDNYVNFAGMCWRVVRIEGDGSIKLTLESQSPCSKSMSINFNIGVADWGYYIDENNNHIGDYKNSTSGMKNRLNTWFDSNFKNNGNLTNSGLKLKDEEWCLSTNDKVYTQSGSYPNYTFTLIEHQNYLEEFYYDSYVRLTKTSKDGLQPTLKCNGEKDISKIGALTADEVVFAGGSLNSGNRDYYLSNYAEIVWWTLSRFGFGRFDFADYENTNSNKFCDSAYALYYEGELSDNADCLSTTNAVRPAVTLKSGVKITGGEGTLSNPYVVE